MRAQALRRAVLSTAALLDIPASAHAAATVDVNGSALRYTAAAAEVNVPAITFVPARRASTSSARPERRSRRLAVVLRVLGNDNGGLGTLVRVRATLRR